MAPFEFGLYSQPLRIVLEVLYAVVAVQNLGFEQGFTKALVLAWLLSNPICDAIYKSLNSVGGLFGSERDGLRAVHINYDLFILRITVCSRVKNGINYKFIRAWRQTALKNHRSEERRKDVAS